MSFRLRFLGAILATGPGCALLLGLDADLPVGQADSRDVGALEAAANADGEAGNTGALPTCSKAPDASSICAKNGACDSETIVQRGYALQDALAAGVIDGLEYPHDVALTQTHVYFSVSAAVKFDGGTVSTLGRDRGGFGAVYRAERSRETRSQRLTTAFANLAYVSVASNGDLLFRATGPDGMSQLRRIQASALEACSGAQNCTSEVLGAWPAPITKIMPTPTGIYVLTGKEVVRVTATATAKLAQSASDIGIVNGAPVAMVKNVAQSGLLDLTTQAKLSEWTSIGNNERLLGGCDGWLLYEVNLGQPQRVQDGGTVPVCTSDAGTLCGKALTYGAARDEGYGYFARTDGVGILRVNLETGEPHRLTVGLADTWDIAVDDDAVYYADINAGIIGRLLKK